MNHIKIYEQLMEDKALSWETRALIKQFYTMPMQEASNTIAKIIELVDAKVNDFMKV